MMPLWKNIMSNKFYVIYEEYSEYNQFEGTWDTMAEDFDTEEAANLFIAGLTHQDYQNIIGPLVNVNPT